MKNIYADNAATSFPKPPEVTEAVVRYMSGVGSNVSRGGYAPAYAAAQTVYETRERLAGLFGLQNPHGVIFTSGVTLSLNLLLAGFLRSGDHLLISSVEHNAVVRPLVRLAQQGIRFDRIPMNPLGQLPKDSLEMQLESLLCPATRAVVMTHASNVSGGILDIGRVGRFCRAHRLRLIVDCAQTAGTLPIDMEEMCIDALAFTGHKGLYGPQGTGGFLITDSFAAELSPVLAGGTGSFSERETMPELLPDRFEAGTPNLPGIYGLHAALGWLEQTGMDTIRAHEQMLTGRFLDALDGQAGVRILGARAPEQRTAVVALDFPERDNAQVAFALEQNCGILTRVGLHCAPDAHRTLGSFPQGAVRFSFGWYNTAEEIDRCTAAVRALLTR